jgi:ABC-type antimicrobial peptide transport system permease subunit
MKNITILLILTGIILAVALFGKYTEGVLRQKATTIYEDRLVPQPYLSRRFDHYGTVVQEAFTKQYFDKDFILSKEKEILEDRRITDSLWQMYLKTYLAPDEEVIAKRAQEEMKDADMYIDKLLLDCKLGNDISYSNLDSVIKPVMNDCNSLIDIQTTIGADETKKIIKLLDTFSNFMIAIVSLVFILSGSIIYSKFKNKEEVPTKKRAVKKPVKKNVPAKRTITKKPTKRK